MWTNGSKKPKTYIINVLATINGAWDAPFYQKKSKSLYPTFMRKGKDPDAEPDPDPYL
jgi:hypothetical protein